MDKPEPTLVPEWLRNAGSSTAGSPTSHSDDHPGSKAVSNKFSVNSNGNDFGRSSNSERTASSYFRRSSSSNSSGNFRSHNGFVRNQRDRDWDKDTYDSRDQENSNFGGRRHRNFSDPLGDTSLSKSERDGLRRSQSMISGKRGEAWPKRNAADFGSASVKISNGLPTKGSSVAGVSKAIFDRDFPSLGVDERAVSSEIGRVPSPGLSTAIQSLPIATSASLGGEKWTSALAEVPMLVGSNGSTSLSVLQTTSSSSTPVVLGSTNSLNMAEAVAHGPIRAQNTPQLSIEAQRLEELAIKQSRQLIPVTPSMPKTSVLNSSDKLKIKVLGQQHSISSTFPVNHSPRGGTVKVDVSKVSKLHVLKPVREKNGVSPVVKENLSPTSVSSIGASPPVPASEAAKGPPNISVPDRKPVLPQLDKRSTSQARSRNDFFNLMRKKNLASPAPADLAATSDLSSLDASSNISPSFSDKHAEMYAMPTISEPVERPLSLSLNVDCLSGEKAGSSCNGDAYDAQKCVSNGKKHHSFKPFMSEEEEIAFLCSMGWEENADGEGLTEEEISAFYRDLTKYTSTSPRILQLVQQILLTPFDSHLGDIDDSCGLSS